MSSLVQIHCRYCGQTYFTESPTIASQQCDLCKKTGGLVPPTVVYQEAQRQDDARKDREKAKVPFGWREQLRIPFALMLFFGCYHLMPREEQRGPVTLAVDLALIFVGIAGLAILHHSQPKPKAGPPVNANEEKPEARNGSEG